MEKGNFQKHLQLQTSIQNALHTHLLEAFNQVLLDTYDWDTSYSPKDMVRMFEAGLRVRQNDLAVLLYPDKDDFSS